MNETKPQAKGTEGHRRSIHHRRGEKEGGREGHENQLPPPKTNPIPSEFKNTGGN